MEGNVTGTEDTIHLQSHNSGANGGMLRATVDVVDARSAKLELGKSLPGELGLQSNRLRCATGSRYSQLFIVCFFCPYSYHIGC